MINSENPIINVLYTDYDYFEGCSDLKPKAILCL